ncbi:MAG TPA: hypothetical protein VIH04_03765 [Nitrosarchaeum sp.]
MKTDKFGMDNYATLITFSQNIRTECQGIRNLISILENQKLHSGIFIEPDYLRTKQYLTLIALTRLVSTIETFLVMCYSLSKGYEHVSKNISFYQFGLLDSILDKILKNKLNTVKVLGFAKIGSLPITNNERKIIWKLYKKSGKDLSKFLKELVEFYDDIKIVYGKSKHGLPLMYGGKFNDKSPFQDYKNTYLITFDRKSKMKLPKNTEIIKSKNVKMDYRWFNTQSILRFSPELFEKIIELSSKLEQYAIYITRNHLLYVKNCGQDYIPYVEKNKKMIFGSFPVKKISKKEFNVISKLIKLTIPQMNIEKKGIQFDLKILRKRLSKSTKTKFVTTFFVD